MSKTGIENYLTASELEEYMSGSTAGAKSVKKMLVNNMNGIEAMPYQFMDTVDRRITGTSVGRKYSEKIIARLPLLFLTPCKPMFMDEFNEADKQTALNFLLDKTIEGSADLFQGTGRYYSVQFDYAEYYKYLDPMLAAVATYLGLYNEKISINGKRSKLGTYAWQNELNPEFASFFSAQENLVFYLDGLTSVQESFSNDTTESSLASQINGFADTANEIKFLFGDKGGALGSIIDGASQASSSIMSSLSGVIGNLGGGIVESLADKGVSTVVNGGKIVFPQIWSDSSFTRSYSIDIKLRSPDHDSLSIYLNVLKPYCKLLALTLPHMIDNNPNGYRSPFLVKAHCKGLFNIDMGIISSMSVTKGAECCWNDDGLPTQIDISLDITDLYSSLAMSKFDKGFKNIAQIVSNTSYMDFLANMAGLNICQMEVGRRITMYYYLTKTKISQTPARLFSSFDNTMSNLIGGLYNIL